MLANERKRSWLWTTMICWEKFEWVRRTNFPMKANSKGSISSAAEVLKGPLLS